MDCDYKDDGGATAGLNVNNNLNSNSLFLKSSVGLLETNNNGQCLITEESDPHELCNGTVEDKHTEKNSPGEISLCTITNQLNGDLAVEDKHTETNSSGEISLCTITNQINKDLAVGKDKCECKSSPEGVLLASMSNELISAEEESLVGNGSSSNQVGKCTSFVSDSEYLVDQTDISDNVSANEKTVNCIEKLEENVSEEGKPNSNSSVDLENCSENISEICTSAADSNLQSNLTLKGSIPVKSDVPEICINTKSNDEISKTESIPSSSEVLDESVSEEEVYLEVDDVDEQESDFSVEKGEDESRNQIDLKSHSICDDVSDSLKTSSLVNESNKTENNVSTNSYISAGETFDEGILESEVFVEVDGLSEKGSVDLEISNENQDASLIKKIVCSLNLDGESPQIESKSEASSSVNEQIQNEMKKYLCKNESAVSEISEKSSDLKSLESNFADKENSSKNSTDMETCENAKTIESNIAAEGNSSNTADMDTSENAKTVESNIAAEGNSSTNVTDMDTSENAKTVESNIPAEGNSSTNVTDMDTSENAKTIESNIAAEGNSSKNAADMETSAETVESNIAIEGNSSKNGTDMETTENAKTIESNIAAEGNSSKTAEDMETIESAETVESNIAIEESSSKNATDMETSEIGKTVELNIAAEGNSSKTAADMETIESAETVESNITIEENFSKNVTDMETIENAKTLESDIAAEGKSSKNSIDMEISESAKVVESNIAVEENSLKNTTEMKTSENAKTIELNIAAEGSTAKNATDTETSEKTNDLDDFLVLSDIEWSDDDDDAFDKQKTKVEAQNVEKDKCVQNEKKCSNENESLKDSVNENPGTSSDGDDFDLDDVIEEFAKEEENKVMKLSDDELDDLVEEFVEAECSSPSVEKNKESESKEVPSESDDEMELLIEDFKAVDSDNDCFIVQDSDNIVIINDDNKDSQPKMKKSKPNDSQSCTGINSTDSSDKVKSDAISSSHNLSKKLEPEASDKVSKNDKTVVQENEVVNNEANTDKNKTFEIGYFKSEIFDNEVEENKQNNGSVLLEIDSENTKNKGVISIVSALPLSERLPGKKVTLECRTDGVYLKKDQNADNNNSSSHRTNENGKRRSINFSTDTSNTVLNGCDKLSVNRSVTNSTNSNSLEEELCMDDMLSKVCASSASNSTNNEECKSTADEKECKKANTSIQLEEKQLASRNGEVKSLGSLCHDNLDDSKKRKLEDLDNKPDEPQKKMKTEVNGVETDMDTAPSSILHVDNSVRKKVLEHFKEAFPTKVQLKKSWLEKLSKRLCQETILEEYQQKIAQQNNVIKNLEDKLQALEDELCYSQSQATAFLSVQQELFQKHHFVPQTAVRTVAVNVKIFRECDVPQPMPLPIVPKVEVPTHTTEIHGSTPVSSTPPIKVQVPQQKIPIPVQQTAVPQTVASARFVSNPMQPRAVITSPQRFVPVAPNVTMMKKEVPPGMSNSQPVRPRSYLAEKTQPPTKTSNQVIDLTDEESSNKKLMPASSTLVSLASNSVSKVSLPGLQNNQNVLLPLNGLFQMVNASTPNNPQFSLSNPVQVQQVSRQALVPTLPPNLLGPRTVAYLIPSNTGQISTIGRNSLPVSNFVSGTNRLQTLLVRVTNPGQVPPMGTVINSNARMPVLTQGLRTPGPKNSPIPSSASDLVLFPRQPKHPAPFPALPEYRQNSQLKALPPKPSLKGSKAPNGIILSWNMSLLNLHAEISNYQLFAYQEAPGPVNASLWKKVGDVKALPLPMACTLTQFIDGNRYYFTVRAVDVHNRFGPYSDAVSIMFSDAKDSSKSLNK